MNHLDKMTDERIPKHILQCNQRTLRLRKTLENMEGVCGVRTGNEVSKKAILSARK
jgi:hypothetical protein